MSTKDKAKESKLLPRKEQASVFDDLHEVAGRFERDVKAGRCEPPRKQSKDPRECREDPLD